MGEFAGGAPTVLLYSHHEASLHDDDGNVAVAGLHENTAAAIAYPTERVRAESGLLDGVREIGSGSVSQRLWAEPAVTVIGIDHRGAAVGLAGLWRECAKASQSRVKRVRLVSRRQRIGCARAQWRQTRLYRQIPAQLGDVAGGTDVVLRNRDLAQLVDDERGPDHALHGFAVHLLLPVGAPGRQHCAVRIRQ